MREIQNTVNQSDKHWHAVGLLGLCSFLMITIEFAPIGLLGFIAQDLQVSTQQVGFAVTIYVLVGALCGVLTSLYLIAMPRKLLLIVVFLLLSLANLGIASAIDLMSLLAFRTLGAIGHGVFWSVVADYAMRLVPLHHKGRASSIVFGGISIGTVFGVPLINLIGSAMSWRIAFITCAVLGLLLTVLLWKFLPVSNTQQNAVRLSLQFIKHERHIALLMLATALLAVFHFASYTYIEPYFNVLVNGQQQWVPLLFLLFGFAGILGSGLCLKYMDNQISRLTICALIAVMLSLIVLAIVGLNRHLWPITLLMLMVWGSGISILFAALQTWVIKLSGEFSAASSALTSAFLNCGIAVGSGMGAVLMKLDNFLWLFAGSAVVALLNLLVIGCAAQRLTRQTQ